MRLPDPGSAPIERLFGTDGIRGVVGVLYTPSFVAEIAAAYGTWLRPPGKVAVAWDFRTTSRGIASILAGTLQMIGFDVVELGVMPTPCSQFNVKALSARGGLMVTASHNPPEFNGIKFTGPDGLEIPPGAETAIEGIYRDHAFLTPRWEAAGSIQPDTAGVDRYLGSIEKNADREAIAKSHPLVVVDAGNGTASTTVPRLVRDLGCQVRTLNANPDGAFPGRKSEPIEANLSDLRRAVVDLGADVGMAFDGDSDRVGLVDSKGHYLTGDVVLGLCARYLLRTRPGSTVVTSVTSSSLVGDVVEREGGKLVVTRSGSLAVALGVAEHHAILGGEENGHYYWPAHQNAPDGPMSAAMVLEMLAKEDRPLAELAAELPAYFLVKESVPVPGRVKALVLGEVREALGREAARIETLDGVKAFFPDGWVLVRPSGTEPLFRVFSESRTASRARSLASRGRELVELALSGSARSTDPKVP
jgi:phosphomannomutase / phosphoglucomutase